MVKHEIKYAYPYLKTGNLLNHNIEPRIDITKPNI